MLISERVDKAIRTIPDFPKKGIMFKDITPVLENANLSSDIVDELVKQCAGVKIDAVAGVESRGFLFGFSMAMKLGVPFVLIRKKGKLPAETVSYKYDLEYGSAEIEMHVDAVEEGMHVLIHDDLLATGGTAVAAAELIQKSGGKVAGFSFVVELSFLKGKEVLNKYSEYNKSIVNY
jgi:adenine phosphoribosyltransferase|tara:strand:- start:127 stop:657 length:531 start_codon:yes stop_codon:yes gene_type:complete